MQRSFSHVTVRPAVAFRPRGPRRPSHICGAFLLAICASACSRAPEPAEAPPSPYPYAAAISHVFVATGRGLQILPLGVDAASMAGRPAPASRAHNASVLGADLSRIAAAVNGYGFSLLRPSPDGAAFALDNTSAPIASRTTGGLWPQGGGFLLQLFRDPFAEEGGLAEGGQAGGYDSGGASLFHLGADGRISALPSAGPEGYELFALFPLGSEAWAASFRKEAAGQAVMRYLRLGPPGASGEGGPLAGSREISRADFEAAVAPRPLSSVPGALGEALRRACAALAPAPPGNGTAPGAAAGSYAAPGAAVLARLRDARGLDRWYGSATAEAREVSAWALADGRVLAMERSGELAIAGSSGEAGRLRIAAPVEGAVFVSVASAGGLMAAAWEAGSFPEIGAAGLVVMALPR